MIDRRWDRMMDGSYGAMVGGGAWGMLLFGLLCVLLLVAGLYVVLRLLGHGPVPIGQPGEPAADSPRDVLDLRLAQGVITSDEYSAARELLRS